MGALGPEQLLDSFERHLRLQRGLSEHSVRAYVADVRDLLAALAAPGPDRGPADEGTATG
ncbi:site-specific integrase, partial [Georgenia sp. 10Sc9-8]|nr:site-specific integrase [Georgenia halotolerans]